MTRQVTLSKLFLVTFLYAAALALLASCNAPILQQALAMSVLSVFVAVDLCLIGLQRSKKQLAYLVILCHGVRVWRLGLFTRCSARTTFRAGSRDRVRPEIRHCSARARLWSYLCVSRIVRSFQLDCLCNLLVFAAPIAPRAMAVAR